MPRKNAGSEEHLYYSTIKAKIIVNYDHTIMIVIEPINDNFATFDWH